MPTEENILSAATRLWEDCVIELKACKDEEAVHTDQQLISPDDSKKVAKWMQHTVTKFGASASVADGSDRKRALQPIADEVIKAFMASIGTLLSLRRGAGPTLVAEILQVGSELASAIAGLGAAGSIEGSVDLGISAGKVLERVKHLENVSCSNRAAIRRRCLKGLRHLRDVNRELQEALVEGKDKDEDFCDDKDDFSDGFGDLDESLEPEERRLLESLSACAHALEEVLKEVSVACSKDGATGLPLLELALVAAASAVDAVDAMTACARGGLEVSPFRIELTKASAATNAFESVAPVATPSLRGALHNLEIALKAAEGADSP